MAKDYNVQITNGSGSLNLANGTYTVSANVPGYDNSTLKPLSVTIEAGVEIYDFTITATGKLKLHVTEDGTDTGVPVEGASFIRCDEYGNEYGTAITTDSTGRAVFNNVPFSATDVVKVYFKQLNSDGQHEFDDTLKRKIMTSPAHTVTIKNAKSALRIINLTEENSNYKVDSGTLTLNG